MKIRTGFVSNSSSSSFIIKTEKDREICDKYNIKYFKVIDIINFYKPIVEILRQFKKIGHNNNDIVPRYLSEEFDWIEYSSIERRYNELSELELKTPNCYISDAYDRDYAYENNFIFEVYEGDL